MSTWGEGGVVGGGILLPNRTRVIIIYPTVRPEVVIVPILTSIVVFPIVVFLVICCLRKMAVRRRQLARLARRDETWTNERSCASIVQRSPPFSFSGDKFICEENGEGTTTVELMTPDPDPDYDATRNLIINMNHHDVNDDLNDLPINQNVRINHI